MFGVDELIAELAEGGHVALVLGVALLLGLRHATDPDHLVAVSTLLATAPPRRARRASALGAAWGLGHATTLLAAGLPVVLLGGALPAGVRAGAQIAVGVLVVVFAARLLVLWRRGTFHAHPHAHGAVVHRHLHRHGDGHAGAEAAHAHGHGVGIGRTRREAYGVGFVHGLAGSAALSVLLVATVDSRAAAAAALVTLALGAAVSMTLFSSLFGWALACAPVERRFGFLAPALGVTSLAFGGWYSVSAFAGL